MELKPLWKDLPQLPLSERDKRWTNIKTKMEEQGIACLVIWGTGRCEHVRYVSQLGTHGVVLFPLKGEPIVFTDMLHLGRYARACQNWIAEVREDVENFPATLKGFGFEKGTIGIVTGRMPHTRLSRSGALSGAPLIQSALPHAKLVDATRLFEDLEMIKSPFEIELLQQAARIAYDVFEAMVDAARPGATECEVYASMLRAQTATGGDATNIWLDVGSPPSLHGRYPPYTTRKLQKGDILITEYHASYAGYLAAAEHSVSLGEPRDEYREIHDVAERCFHRGMASMVAGAEFSDVITAYREPADKAGLKYVELGIHGHGLSSCEPPTTVFGGNGGILHRHYLGQIPAIRLQENMVFGQNIDLHNPQWNPHSGLMLGDTVWVTKEGPRKLTQIPVELTVI